MGEYCIWTCRKVTEARTHEWLEGDPAKLRSNPQGKTEAERKLQGRMQTSGSLQKERPEQTQYALHYVAVYCISP